MDLVFIDFDGVLRRESAPRYRLEKELVSNFEKAVLSSPETGIVITSSWREVSSLEKLKGLFSEEIAERIVGTTPRARELEDFYRYREILAFLQRNGMENSRWIAVDDDPMHFPAGAPVLIVDPARGLDDASSRELRRVILGWVS